MKSEEQPSGCFYISHLGHPEAGSATAATERVFEGLQQPALLIEEEEKNGPAGLIAELSPFFMTAC